MELNELKEKAILLKEENTKLRNEVNAKKVEAETLQNLTEKIKSSSFVEQKEDGSIEITINVKNLCRHRKGGLAMKKEVSQ